MHRNTTFAHRATILLLTLPLLSAAAILAWDTCPNHGFTKEPGEYAARQVCWPNASKKNPTAEHREEFNEDPILYLGKSCAQLCQSEESICYGDREYCSPHIVVPENFNFNRCKSPTLPALINCKETERLLDCRIHIQKGDFKCECKCRVRQEITSATLAIDSGPIAPGGLLHFALSLDGDTVRWHALTFYVSVEDPSGEVVLERVLRPRAGSQGRRPAGLSQAVRMPEHLSWGRYQLIVGVKEGPCDAVVFERGFAVE